MTQHQVGKIFQAKNERYFRKNRLLLVLGTEAVFDGFNIDYHLYRVLNLQSFKLVEIAASYFRQHYKIAV
mgnify:CR=1 FL=1